MEEFSALQWMNRYVQLGKDLDGIRVKMIKQNEVFLQIHDAILSGIIDFSPSVAAFKNAADNLSLATDQSLEKAAQQYLSCLARLDNVINTIYFLEMALNNLKEMMGFQRNKVADLIIERRQLAYRVRYVDVKVYNIEDVDLVLSLHKVIKWNGKIRLAAGLESARKDVLTWYICATALKEVFIR
jgi:hypothetical protein